MMQRREGHDYPFVVVIGDIDARGGTQALYHWCRDRFGPMDSRNIWVWYDNHEFWFADEDHATLFELTWG